MANIPKDKVVEKQKKCNSCCETIDSSAKVCHHCGCYQKFWSGYFRDPAIIVSIAMVLISLVQVILASKQNIDASRAKETAEKAANDANIILIKVLSDANEIEKLKRQLLEQIAVHNLWLNFYGEENDDLSIMFLNELESKEPNNWLVYDFRAETYRRKARREEDLKKKEELLLKAENDYEKSYKHHRGMSIIHLADICAELNDEEGCRKWLERGMTDNSLPSLKDAERFGFNIKNKYSNREWFKNIKWNENKYGVR
jgi:hypothetical protein